MLPVNVNKSKRSGLAALKICINVTAAKGHDRFHLLGWTMRVTRWIRQKENIN